MGAGNREPPMPAAASPAYRTTTTVDVREQSKTKLLQARAQFKELNFDAAEALAKEVARQNLSYRPDEDSPAKVLKDIAAARSDATILLHASRNALARKNFDQADKYARLADKSAGVFTFPMWGDTPSKALKDIANARKSAMASVKAPAGAPAMTSPARPVTPPATPRADETEKARALLKQARQDLTAGKTEEAKKHTAEARALKTNLGWWEDNPERLEADIRRIESARRRSEVAKSDVKPVSATTVVSTKSPANTGIPRTKQEAKDLLAQGRKQLDEGKLDDAARITQRVKALTSASWGLFEDSPDRLQINIDKAREKRDRAESVAVLAEARKLYERGDYENASRLAYKSQKLHGPYSILDLGDRPNKLLAEIQTAQAQARKRPLPPAAVARNTTPPVPSGAPMPMAGNTRVASLNGDVRPAAPPAPSNGLPSGISPMAAPAANMAAPPPPVMAQASAMPPAPLMAQASVMPPAPVMVASPPAPVAPAPNKLRAQQLVAEAQRLLTEGMLIEARLKAIEAQRLNASFGPDEVSPELVYQQISVQARQRIDALVRRPTRVPPTAPETSPRAAVHPRSN